MTAGKAFQDVDLAVLREALEIAQGEVMKDEVLVRFVVRNHIAKRLFRYAERGPLDANELAKRAISRVRHKAGLRESRPDRDG